METLTQFDKKVLELRKHAKEAPDLQDMTRRYLQDKHYRLIFGMPTELTPMDKIVEAVRFAAYLCNANYKKEYSFFTDGEKQLVASTFPEKKVIEILQAKLEPPELRAKRMAKLGRRAGNLLEGPGDHDHGHGDHDFDHEADASSDWYTVRSLLRARGHRVHAVLTLDDMCYDENFVPDTLLGCLDMYRDERRNRFRIQRMRENRAARVENEVGQPYLRAELDHLLTAFMDKLGVDYKVIYKTHGKNDPIQGAITAIGNVVTEFTGFMDHVQPGHEDKATIQTVRTSSSFALIVVNGSMHKYDAKARAMTLKYLKSSKVEL